MNSRSSFLAPRVEGTGGTVYRWCFGDVTFEVDAGNGARITRYGFGNANVLGGPELNALNFGSTFWTSPQSDWGWPPVVEIDVAPYAVTGDGANVQFHSPGGGTLDIAVTKRFEVDPDRESVAIEYTMENRGQGPRTVAPWEISRVPTGGLSFFPAGAGIQPRSTLAAREIEGVIWFEYDPRPIVDHQKLFAHASEGWLAHVDVPRRMLLVKTFPEVAPVDQAPGEAHIELYADPTHSYVELEQQGAHRVLDVAERISWSVTWRLRRLPAGIDATIASKDLLALVRTIAAQGR